MGGLHGILGSLWDAGVLGGLDRQQHIPYNDPQTTSRLLDTVPNTCLGSEEQLRPGQAPGVVPTSVLLLAHDGRYSQALVPEQGPLASGSSGSLPCRDRKGVRKPGENATTLYSVLWLSSWMGD